MLRICLFDIPRPQTVRVYVLVPHYVALRNRLNVGRVGEVVLMHRKRDLPLWLRPRDISSLEGRLTHVSMLMKTILCMDFWIHMAAMNMVSFLWGKLQL